jgi:type II secretory pathway component GspD/PulD (secretin)
MARKKIRRILSGGAIVLFVVLFCVLGVSVQAFEAVKVTYTISGSAGVSGVTMKGLPGPPVVTDQNGYYSATVDWDWKGTVMPVLEGYEFTPASKIYSKVTGNMSNEDYTPSEITYTISGKVGMEGVEMNGLPGNPITGTDGTYSATVKHGWQNSVTPIKEGYEFKPSKREYPPVKSNQTNHDYTPEPMMLLIAGSVGVEGVVMDGLPDNPVSMQGGNYSAKVKYGWNGTVTPKKEGYEFSPANTDYSNVIETQSNQDYTATALTYVISGTAGMAGVQMKGLPGDPVTDENGYYTATVEYGFNQTVEPTLAGYNFNPASKIYTKVNSDRLNENYSAAMIKVTISGTTRMEGVVMNGLPGNPVTGKDGSYSVTVDYGWSDTVTPTKEGYTFTPESKPYVSVTGDMANQNFTAKRITFTISGSTTVPGVAIKGFPGKAVVSNSSGTYSATVDYGSSCTITPTKDGYDFNPPNIKIDNILGDQTNQNFTPTIQKRTISGQVLSQKGQPVADVYLLAEGAGSATTNAKGEYELLVDHGWPGKITPTKEGYTFNPATKPYSPVTSDQTRQNFSAIVRTFTITDFVIIGNTPIAGVTITAKSAEGTVDDTTTTDATGKFTVTVPYGWTGEIIPTKEGLQFNPSSQTYPNVTGNYLKGQLELMRTTTPTPTPPVTTPTPSVTTPKPPVTTPTPTVTTPTPTVTTPTPSAATPTPPVTTEVAEPKTPLEQNIATMQKQLAQLLRQRSGEGQVPATPGGEMAAGTGGPLISNTFVDNDLPTEVLPAIATQAGISIIPDETVAGIITADIQDKPLDTALEIVLAGTPYVVKKTPYYYLVCSGGIKDTMFSKVSETRRLRMNYITSEAAVGLLSTPFREYAQSEIGPTGTDTYTVVVTAPPKLMDRIVADLKQIDRPLSQILLDARVVVMEKGDLLNLGVEWGWPKIQAGMFSSDHYGRGEPTADFGGEGPWGIQIGYTPDALFTNALELTLNLLAQNGEATILTKPQVLAQDGKESKIEVTTEEYYMLVAPEVVGSFYTRTELQTIISGTTLTITPHLGDNNDITLQVAVEVSDSIPRGAGNELPVVTRRKANNNVTIKDGGTVALAGLTENKTRKDIRRVPGLSSLPLIGGLFKNSNNQNSTREIAVFVTARLVSNRGQTVEFTQPSDVPAPIRPAGNDFKARLRESLSRR